MIKLLIIGLVLLQVSFLAGYTQCNQNAMAKVESAKKLMLSDKNQAIELCNEAVKIDPKCVKAFDLRGLIHRLQGDYESALMDYDQAIAIAPGNSKLYYNKGEVLNWMKKYEDALTNYCKAAELDPGNPDYIKSRAMAYYLTEKYQEALNDYRTYKNMNVKETEIRSLMSTIMGFPKYEDAKANEYLNTGTDYSKNNDERTNILTKAIKEYPDFAAAYFERGKLFLETEKYQEAQEDFTKCLSLFPLNYMVYSKRGEADLRLRKYALAVEDFDNALLFSPENDVALEYKVEACIGLKEYDKAIETAKYRIEKKTGDKRAPLLIPEIYRAKGDYDKAVEECNALIKTLPQSKNDVIAETYFIRGTAQIDNGFWHEGIADIEYAKRTGNNSAKEYIEKISDIGEHCYKTGNDYYNSSDYKRAASAFSVCVDNQYKLSDVYYLRGNCYSNLNLQVKAVSDYKNAVNLGNTDAQAGLDKINEKNPTLQEKMDRHGSRRPVRRD